MKNKKIEIIIHKFLINTATLDELDILAKWVDKNKSSFQEEVELHHLITGAGEEESTEHLKKNLISAFNHTRLVAGKVKKRNLLLSRDFCRRSYVRYLCLRAT